MNALRIEADDASAKVEELQTKVKTLEQENLNKAHEITSLQHKNGVLEGEVEKLEKLHGDAKSAAEESSQHGTQNETLTRRMQLLEDEAEENDKNLRETNEKSVCPALCPGVECDLWPFFSGAGALGLTLGLLTLPVVQTPSD